MNIDSERPEAGTLEGVKHARLIAAAAVGLVLFAVQDILLWAVIFEADELWQYIGIYHRGWFVTLAVIVAGGFVWLWPRWKYGLLHAATVLTLAFSGLEDILYYVLQLKPIPDTLPWLDLHPLVLFSPVTRDNLIASALIWLLFWVIVYAALPADN